MFKTNKSKKQGLFLFKRVVAVLLALFVVASSLMPCATALAEEEVSAQQEVITPDAQQNESASEEQVGEDSAEETTIADSLSAPPKAAPSTSSKTLVKESEDYKVSVKIDEESVGSADAELVVEEIDKDSEEYKVYITESAKKMEVEEEDFAFDGAVGAQGHRVLRLHRFLDGFLDLLFEGHVFSFLSTQI